ncbi:hypothetical protein [Burkholderia cepacia]|uniref:hypothetical protein n=1 Tax=Burkholderia cepacia TaxID=292 RepID=UPI0012D85517|nr:hypothetical protein [Burkholderia cepacia]
MRLHQDSPHSIALKRSQRPSTESGQQLNCVAFKATRTRPARVVIKDFVLSAFLSENWLPSVKGYGFHVHEQKWLDSERRIGGRTNSCSQMSKGATVGVADRCAKGMRCTFGARGEGNE